MILGLTGVCLCSQVASNIILRAVHARRCSNSFLCQSRQVRSYSSAQPILRPCLCCDCAVNSLNEKCGCLGFIDDIPSGIYSLIQVRPLQGTVNTVDHPSGQSAHNPAVQGTVRPVNHPELLNTSIVAHR